MDYETLTLDEVQARLGDLLLDCARIRQQIEEAKAKAKGTGQYSDPDWFQRVRFALRIKCREQQLLQLELGRRRRQRAAAAMAGRRFMDVAQDLLDPALFDELLEEFQRRRAQDAD